MDESDKEALGDVFPAHAGMSRDPIERYGVTLSFPRSRGDEPRYPVL